MAAAADESRRPPLSACVLARCKVPLPHDELACVFSVSFLEGGVLENTHSVGVRGLWQHAKAMWQPICRHVNVYQVQVSLRALHSTLKRMPCLRYSFLVSLENFPFRFMTLSSRLTR
jgi:hypothetical protein